MDINLIKNKPTIQLESRDAWRQWLRRNHTSCPEIWLVFYKKESGKQRYTKTDALEEALCFGWIDSLVQTIDEERFMQKFTPRKPNSQWSNLNKKHVERLEQRGLMTSVGRALVDQAKRSGEWDSERERAIVTELPPDLQAILERNPAAKRAWDAQAPSHRRQYLQWIMDAKREETRLRRCEKAIKMLTSGLSPSML